jgi:hypothetical protein
MSKTAAMTRAVRPPATRSERVGDIYRTSGMWLAAVGMLDSMTGRILPPSQSIVKAR